MNGGGISSTSRNRMPTSFTNDYVPDYLSQGCYRFVTVLATAKLTFNCFLSVFIF